jgi:hypothetical protein
VCFHCVEFEEFCCAVLSCVVLWCCLVLSSVVLFLVLSRQNRTEARQEKLEHTNVLMSWKQELKRLKLQDRWLGLGLGLGSGLGLGLGLE